MCVRACVKVYAGMRVDGYRYVYMEAGKGGQIHWN